MEKLFVSIEKSLSCIGNRYFNDTERVTDFGFSGLVLS